jgi:nitrite reductase/ring-hydroxylating ferredoxin subunit
MAQEKIRVAASAEVTEGALFSTQAQGKKLLLSRIKGRAHGVIDRCPHMGMSLAKGKIEAGVVTCPWHNSRFDLCTGRNMDWVSAFLGMPMPKWTHKAIAMGKSPAPLAVITVEEADGQVYAIL